MPDRVTCEGREYEHVETFKHDTFAATGMYRAVGSPGDRTVLKINRVGAMLGLPMKWGGRWLARREMHLYRLCQDLPNVPPLTGAVGETGLMHAFVPGHPLGRDERVSDDFFAELQSLVATLHARHVAYVDLNKRQNILVGEDGRPYLIDFQISLHLPPTGWRRLWPVQWFLARFQHADVYHILKHKRRLRPDLLASDERAIVEKLSIWIRLHRFFFRPITQLRRWILRWLAKDDDVHVAGSEAK